MSVEYCDRCYLAPSAGKCVICKLPACAYCSLPALKTDENGKLIIAPTDEIICSGCNPPNGGSNAKRKRNPQGPKFGVSRVPESGRLVAIS